MSSSGEKLTSGAEAPGSAEAASADRITPEPGRWSWLIPNLTVFMSSLCIMVVELVAGRLIARHVGSSLYTWTSVIGIVLAGIAVGNYIGGRLADRYRAREALASLFLLSSAACLLIPLLNERVGQFYILRSQEWSLRIALHVFFVFFLPSALMGTISPVAAKMALGLGRETGRTVGSVYSWGAVGSIVGTFMTGYFLIAQLGTVAVLLSVAAVLLAMSMFFGAQSLLPYLWMGVLGANLLAHAGPWEWTRTVGERLGLREVEDEFVHFLTESQYSFIRVEEEPDMPGVRSMTLDFLVHAYVSRSRPGRAGLRVRERLRRRDRGGGSGLAARTQAPCLDAGRRRVRVPALDVAALAGKLYRSSRDRSRSHPRCLRSLRPSREHAAADLQSRRPQPCGGSAVEA